MKMEIVKMLLGRNFWSHYDIKKVINKFPFFKRYSYNKTVVDKLLELLF